MPAIKDSKAIRLGSTPVRRIHLGATQVYTNRTFVRYDYQNDRTHGAAYCEQTTSDIIPPGFVPVNTGNLIQPRMRDRYAVYSDGSSEYDGIHYYDSKTLNTSSCPVPTKGSINFSASGIQYGAPYITVYQNGDIIASRLPMNESFEVTEGMNFDISLDDYNCSPNFNRWVASADVTIVSGGNTTFATFRVRDALRGGQIIALFGSQWN